MKKSWKFISMLAAMAVGGASAQNTTPATPAGTTITNQAEIVYTPEGSTTPADPVKSNEVKTTVLPVPSFTITPNDNNNAGPTDQPHYNAPGQTGNVKPCDKNVSFLYTLTNTGNVPKESYTIENTPPAAADGVRTPENIRFAIDANKNGQLDASELAAATTTLTVTNVEPGEANQIKFFQIYDVPCDLKDGEKVGGDPTGTRNDNPAFNNDPTLPKDADNTNVVTAKRLDGVIIGPKDDPDGNGNPVTPPYTSPEGYQIVPSASDSETATVPTLSTTTTTTVTFTNTFTNTGNRTDTFELTQTNNFPAGSTVVFKDINGNVLPDADGDGNPEVKDVPAGGTVSIITIVTLPAGTTPAQMAGERATTITITSQNDPTKSDTTKDIIKVTQPGLSFGNPTPNTPGGDPTIPGTPPSGVPGNPTTPIKPGDPATCTGSTRTYLPMEIANLGAQDDTYTVTGMAPVTVLNSDGTVNPTPVIVSVVYYKDVNGDGKLDGGDTPLTNGNTGIIKPGEEMKLIAVVDVPCAAAKQTITLNQVAKSDTDPRVNVPDINDTITVGDNGQKPTADKKIIVNGVEKDASEAKPGDTITYKIVGKNTTNGNITRAMVCDTVPANTTYVGMTAASNAAGTVLYSQDGGSTWKSSITAPVNGKLCAAVNTNGDSNITTADILKPGETITVTFQVKVN